MIVNDKNRFVFIAVPRTASMSIRTALLESVPGSINVDPHHGTDVPDRCRTYQLIAVVRHPFDRLRALWWSYQAHQVKAERWKHKGTRVLFDDFKGYMVANGLQSIRSFLRDSNLPTRPPTLIRYEDIQNSQLPESSPFGALQIPWLGRRKAKLSQDKEYFETIYDLHREDFEHYEYELAHNTAGKCENPARVAVRSI